MSRPEDLEPRVSALESEVQELRSRVRGSERDAAAARVLAGGADRDVEQIRGEIRDLRRALTAGFNATREDILDLRRRFDDVDRGFAEVRGTFDAMAAGQQQIVALLTTVIDQQGGVGP
jgi:predicted  nucleic acid-binding Zn-ribbon protein